MIDTTKIAVITPTRGDRVSLLNRCKHYVAQQTIPVKHYVIDDELGLDGVDLTHRIYIGLNRAKKDGFRYVFIMEDDDWYAKDYIETYLNTLESKYSFKNSLNGINYTNYCHIEWNKRWFLIHNLHASLFTAMIDLETFPVERLKELPSYQKLDGSLDWELFKLRKLCKSTTFHMDVKQIGIKHAVGKAGGHGHDTKSIYQPRFGSAFSYLEKYLPEEDLNYYKSKEWKQ